MTCRSTQLQTGKPSAGRSGDVWWQGREAEAAASEVSQQGRAADSQYCAPEGERTEQPGKHVFLQRCDAGREL